MNVYRVEYLGEDLLSLLLVLGLDVGMLGRARDVRLLLHWVGGFGVVVAVVDGNAKWLSC